MDTEPAAIIGTITTALGAILALLIAFGINLSDEQTKAMLATVGAVVPFIIVMLAWIRSRVVSPKSAGEAVAIAKAEPPSTNVVPEIEVSGYKESVLNRLAVEPITSDLLVRDITWQPTVDAH